MNKDVKQKWLVRERSKFWRKGEMELWKKKNLLFLYQRKGWSNLLYQKSIEPLMRLQTLESIFNVDGKDMMVLPFKSYLLNLWTYIQRTGSMLIRYQVT